MEPTKILLVDDHALLRKGLRLLIDQEDDLQVVAEAGDGESAVRVVQEHQPDIVIMDITMPGLNGIEATRQILDVYPQTRILALSIHSEKEFVDDMLVAGASGYLLKESAPEELIAAIHMVTAGDVYLSTAITNAIVSEYRTAVSDSLTSAISKIEQITGPILTTKFYPPSPTPDLEPRGRLLERLDLNIARSLTLISAPAGYGKTVLASQWLESSQHPSAWLSLDRSDNDPTTFISYLLAAILNAFPDLQLKTLDLLQAANLPAVSLLAQTLVNDLDQIDQPFILVLDDIHRIHDSKILDLFDLFLQHPPRHLHLVLVGRQDPAFEIVSLRARGQVIEIRTFDLRFTAEETARLMQKILDREVDPAVAADWAQQSDGWVTALRLAVLSLRHRSQDSDLSLHIRGDSRYLRDYLLADVLAHLPKLYQDCLIKISFLDRFCASVCEAICEVDADNELEGMDGDVFIAWLKRENLFLEPLDDQHQWFRFHHLFQQSLLEMLQHQMDPEQIAGLRKRASRWFAEHDLTNEAIQYALAARDYQMATHLFAQNRNQLINAERWDQLARLIGLFPDDVIDNDPLLTITKTYLPIYGPIQVAIRSRAKQLAADLPADSPIAREVRGEIAYFDLLDGILAGPPDAVIEQANEALALLSQQAEYTRCGLISTKAVSHQMSGDYQQGVSLINETLAAPEWSDAARARLFVIQAYIFFFEGDLRSAQLWAGESLRIASRIRLWHTIGESQYLLGISHYLCNEIDQAERHLSFLIENRFLCNPIFVAHGVCALVRIYHTQQQSEKAAEVFELALSHLEETENQFTLDILHAFQIELAIDQEDLALARHHYQLIEFGFAHPVWFQFMLPLIPIKLGLAEGGDLENALTALKAFHQQLVGLNRKTHQVEVLALLALVHQARGDQQMADECLLSALALGAIGENIRSFVDLGTPMADMLRRLQAHKADDQLAGYIDQILAAFPESSRPPVFVSQSQLEVPLTDRELEVLDLLARRLTNKEIAAELVISPRTVKRHTLNIYQKMEVNSRREAVEKAANLGIIV